MERAGMTDKVLVHLVAAARPNFVKVAPLYHALSADPDFTVCIVHTGQHYDVNLSEAFFTDLRLPAPDFHLGVGSGTHAEQTGQVMIGYERICLAERPDWTVVVGDVNSTVAAALVSAKLLIPVAHLEAGLRSRDRTMPEEINRMVTDAISDLLWTPSSDADENLLREGVPASRIDRVGNIMIDSYELLKGQIESDATVEKMGLTTTSYGFVTLHRPSNVDRLDSLALLVDQLVVAANSIDLIFPVHPRTRKMLEEYDLIDKITSSPGIRLIEPLGYIQSMSLLRQASLVITDSGGLQEETTYLGIPCLTMRPNTERPITIEKGTNKLVDAERLAEEVATAQSGAWSKGSKLDLWDGQTAHRCVKSLKKRLDGLV